MHRIRLFIVFLLVQPIERIDRSSSYPRAGKRQTDGANFVAPDFLFCVCERMDSDVSFEERGEGNGMCDGTSAGIFTTSQGHKMVLSHCSSGKDGARTLTHVYLQTHVTTTRRSPLHQLASTEILGLR